jgi:hypothetical protein
MVQRTSEDVFVCRMLNTTVLSNRLTDGIDVASLKEQKPVPVERDIRVDDVSAMSRLLMMTQRIRHYV